MEKDRALNLLQNGLLPVNHGAYHEALKMAIEALQQQPCEDVISRQDAIDALIGWETELLDEDIERELRKLPSVTPRQAPCEEREKGECPFYAG